MHCERSLHAGRQWALVCMVFRVLLEQWSRLNRDTRTISDASPMHSDRYLFLEDCVFDLYEWFYYHSQSFIYLYVCACALVSLSLSLSLSLCVCDYKSRNYLIRMVYAKHFSDTFEITNILLFLIKDFDDAIFRIAHLSMTLVHPD